MSDAIILAGLGTPAIAVITEPFWEQSAVVARSKGIADIPRVRVRYPIAGTGQVGIAAAAREAAPAIAEALRAP